MLNIFNKYVDFRIVDSIMTLIRDIVNIAEYVIFILLGVLALSQKTVTIPLLDPFIDKHMN